MSWAGTSTALARLSGRYDAPVLSSLRLLFATPLLLVFFVAGPEGTAPPDLSSLPVLAMVASGLVGYGIGDTTYIRTMSRVRIQRVAPTTTAAWVGISAVGGIIFLGEPAAWSLAVGGAAIVAGCWLIVAKKARETLAAALPGEWGPRRTMLAILVVATAWAAATLLLAAGRGTLTAAAAALVRIPAGGLMLAAVALTTKPGGVVRRVPNGRDLALIAVVGLLGTGLGSWLYIYAVGEAGAARAVILNATSPLAALPLAVIFLGERLTRRVVAGTLLCVAGTVVMLSF